MKRHHTDQATSAAAYLAVWTLGWLATLAAARFGPSMWDSDAASWVAVAANVAVGAGLIVAYAGYLRRVDELQRKINLDALAVTLGVGFVGGLAYVVADRAGLIKSDLDIALFPALLGVVYLVTMVVGYLRYR